MSNPGVKVLSKKKINSEMFILEDNIGEAIHLHYGKTRFDFSIKDFLEFYNVTKKTSFELVSNEIFRYLDKMDPTFVNMFSQYIYDIERIFLDKIKLGDIICQTDIIKGRKIYKKLTFSRVLKFLKGDTKDYLNYNQENHPFQTNEERLTSVLNIIKEKGYPNNGNYIILFNNQNFVRDGQHRAACLCFLYGNIEVPVIRVCFKHPELVNIKIESRFKNFMKRLVKFVKRKLFN